MINFKVGNYKFEAVGLCEKATNSNTTNVHKIDDFSAYFDEDGTLNKYKDEAAVAYETLFNDLNKSLLVFMDKK